MKKKINQQVVSMFLAFIMVFTIQFRQVEAAPVLIKETIDRQIVTKGLVYEHKARFTNEGWVDIHVLIMDLQEENVAMKVMRSVNEFGLRGTMTGFAAADPEVVAGVNASFFNMSQSITEPIGIYYEEEEFGYVQHNYNTGGGTGATTLIQREDDSVSFDFFGISMKLTTDEGKPLYLYGINKIQDLQYPAIFNQLYGVDTKQLDASGEFYKIVVEEDVVTDVVEPKVVAQIPENGYIISLSKDLSTANLPNFTVGTGINIQLNSTISTDDIKFAISGGGKIMENGQLINVGMNIETGKRHPRTAVGVTGDNRYLVAMVVDGRGDSIGATHSELCDYLKAYQVTDAIHMDGGGSSTMVGSPYYEDKVGLLNTPSDGAQRKVVNGLGFVSLSEPGLFQTGMITLSSDSVFVNNPIQFSFKGYDSNYNEIEIDQSKVVWSIEGVEWDLGTNSFTPTTAGNGKLICYYNGISTSVNFKSLDNAIDMSVEPRILELDYNESGSFRISGIDISGYEGTINSKDVSYEIEDPTIVTQVDGVFQADGKTGLTKVLIKSGYRTTTAYVAVGKEQSVVEEFDSFDYSERSYPTELVSGSIAKETQLVRSNTSYKMNYNFSQSIDTQAFYMMINDYTIESATDIIGLYVYGNESGHMLRGRVVDANGTSQVLNFTSNIDWTGWKEVSAEVDASLVYPLTLDRIYVVTLQSQAAYSGTLYIDDLSVKKNVNTSNLRFDINNFISDPLMAGIAPTTGTEFMFFGATANRNRLMDNLIMEKVYEKMNAADIAFFCGQHDFDKNKMKNTYAAWNNKYVESQLSGVKIIQLGTGSGGIRATDYTQYNTLQTALAKTTEKAIVILADHNPLKNFDDSSEGEILHDILKSYVQKSNKLIFYVSAGGYETDATLLDGVRYIDLSGLWYKVNDRNVDLNKTFYGFHLYNVDGEFSYRLDSLYPLVEAN